MEFLHTGNYQYPDPSPASSGKQSAPEEPSQDLVRPGIVEKPSDKAKSGSNRPLTPLDKCLSNIPLQEQNNRETDQARLDRFSAQDDYRELLFSHAKVYSLAHRKSIHALQVLALRRLSMVLLKINPIQPDSPTTLNFIDLAKYVYSHTDSLVSSEEPLRKLISQFAALNITVLQNREEMAGLMSEGGDFVNELTPKVGRRVTITKKSPKPEVKKEPPVQPLAKPPAKPPSRSIPNPYIKYFNTGEVHNWRDPWGKTSKVIFFGTTYSEPPGIPVGLNTLDVGNHNNIRVNSFASNIGRDRFRIHIDSWENSLIFSAGCAWLEIQKNDPDFQYGRFCTLEDHLHPQTLTSRLITFPRAYSAPPVVVVWLAGFDIQRDTFWRVKTYVTNVTATNFVLHIDTWSDTILHSATASWVSYPANMPKVCSGSFGTSDVRPIHPPQLQTDGNVNFRHGIFNTPPHALLAFNYIDINCCENLRVRLDYSSMTTAGMNWHISSWENTVVYSVEASYIALAW